MYIQRLIDSVTFSIENDSRQSGFHIKITCVRDKHKLVHNFDIRTLVLMIKCNF